MQNIRRTLPALPHLNVFDAAVRHMSFTLAGRELGVTQAAVSYSIRMLEQDLGVTLFTRNGRNIALTEVGERFARDVSLGLAHLRQSVLSIRKTGATQMVSLSVSSAFATFWIMPRLNAFRERFPEIDLQVRSTDRDIDLALEDMSLGVRYGSGILPSYSRADLADEIIYPVCSPAYAAKLSRAPERCTARDVARAQLIHLDEPFRDCPIWADWLHAQGHTPKADLPMLILNDYVLVIQATLEGQGIAMGWHHLVEQLVRRGALVRVTPHVWETGVVYTVVWSGPLGRTAAKVRDWLLEA